MKIKTITEIRHTDGVREIHTGTHIKIIKPNGKRKVYTVEKYHLIQIIKASAVIIAAIAVMMLFCGAVSASNHPAKPFLLVVMTGIILFALIAGLYLIFSASGERKYIWKKGDKK